MVVKPRFITIKQQELQLPGSDKPKMVPMWWLIPDGVLSDAAAARLLRLGYIAIAGVVIPKESKDGIQSDK